MTAAVGGAESGACNLREGPALPSYCGAGAPASTALICNPETAGLALGAELGSYGTGLGVFHSPLGQ